MFWLKTQSEKSVSSSFFTLSKIVNHPIFTQVIIGLIILNGVIVGLETYPAIYTPYKEMFHWIDLVILWIFTIEILLRMLAIRPIFLFFKDSWNLFDLLLVVSNFLFVDAHYVMILRILRILRVLRAISAIPSLRRLVEALLHTIPALGNITLLLGIFFYVFAVMGTIFFSRISPEYFGSLHQSLLTLFQVVTLEAWASDIMRPILELSPWAWVYFVSFILIGTFVILNLFVGVIVNKVESVNATQEEKNREMSENEVQQMEREVYLLRQEISELKDLVLGLQKEPREK